jgi:hypothetical protein
MNQLHIFKDCTSLLLVTGIQKIDFYCQKVFFCFLFLDEIMTRIFDRTVTATEQSLEIDNCYKHVCSICAYNRHGIERGKTQNRKCQFDIFCSCARASERQELFQSFPDFLCVGVGIMNTLYG